MLSTRWGKGDEEDAVKGAGLRGRVVEENERGEGASTNNKQPAFYAAESAADCGDFCLLCKRPRGGDRQQFCLLLFHTKLVAVVVAVAVAVVFVAVVVVVGHAHKSLHKLRKFHLHTHTDTHT